MNSRAVIISIDVSSLAISATQERTGDVLVWLRRDRPLGLIQLTKPEDDAPRRRCLTLEAIHRCSNVVLLLTPADASVNCIRRPIHFAPLRAASDICSTGSQIPEVLLRCAHQKTGPTSHSSRWSLF